MRTTLTLLEDVAALIERMRRERTLTLKEIVNEALRVGLERMQSAPPPEAGYRTPVESLGGCRRTDLDDVAGALAFGEGEGFR